MANNDTLGQINTLLSAINTQLEPHNNNFKRFIKRISAFEQFSQKTQGDLSPAGKGILTSSINTIMTNVYCKTNILMSQQNEAQDED